MTSRATDQLQTPLRVGIVGASPGNSWASRSHVPAIAAVAGLELAAVATSREETARAASEQFRARQWFVGGEQLAEADDVDLIIVAVKVPYHRELVAAALSAGKHVYCEWPLGVDRAEAELMAHQAANATGRNAIGLQARSSPTLRYLADLLRDGYIGAVESCSATAYSQRGADPVTAAKKYLFDERTGANLSTIETGHLLDALSLVLGEPSDLCAISSLQRPHLQDAEGRPFTSDTADTVTAMWRSEGGAQVSMHLAQGTHALFKTEISIIGSAGAIQLSTTAPGGIQMAPLELWGAQSTSDRLTRLPIPPQYSFVADPGIASAANVAEALHAFARDINDDSRTVPDFSHAVARHSVLERLREPHLQR